MPRFSLFSILLCAFTGFPACKERHSNELEAVASANGSGHLNLLEVRGGELFHWRCAKGTNISADDGGYDTKSCQSGYQPVNFSSFKDFLNARVAGVKALLVERKADFEHERKILRTQAGEDDTGGFDKVEPDLAKFYEQNILLLEKEVADAKAFSMQIVSSKLVRLPDQHKLVIESMMLMGALRDLNHNFDGYLIFQINNISHLIKRDAHLAYFFDRGRANYNVSGQCIDIKIADNSYTYENRCGGRSNKVEQPGRVTSAAAGEYAACLVADDKPICYYQDLYTWREVSTKLEGLSLFGNAIQLNDVFFAAGPKGSFKLHISDKGNATWTQLGGPLNQPKALSLGCVIDGPDLVCEGKKIEGLIKPYQLQHDCGLDEKGAFCVRHGEMLRVKLPNDIAVIPFFVAGEVPKYGELVGVWVAHSGGAHYFRMDDLMHPKAIPFSWGE